MESYVTWLLPRRMGFSRLVHIGACISASFPSVAQQRSLVWMDRGQCFWGWTFGFFSPLAVMHNAAVHPHVRVGIFISLGSVPRSGIVGSCGHSRFTFGTAVGLLSTASAPRARPATGRQDFRPARPRRPSPLALFFLASSHAQGVTPPRG